MGCDASANCTWKQSIVRPREQSGESPHQHLDRLFGQSSRTNRSERWKVRGKTQRLPLYGSNRGKHCWGLLHHEPGRWQDACGSLSDLRDRKAQSIIIKITCQTFNKRSIINPFKANEKYAHNKTHNCLTSEGIQKMLSDVPANGLKVGESEEVCCA